MPFPLRVRLIKLELLGAGLPAVPEDLCCNCGRTSGLSLHPTPLRVTRAGTEWTHELALPYCAGCARTARRVPPGVGVLFSRWTAGSLVLFLAGLGACSLLGLEWPLGGSAGLLAASAVAGLGLSVGWPLRRPRRPQTSLYQPVRALKLRQSPLGETIGLVVGFTHAAYALRFLELNPTSRRMV